MNKYKLIFLRCKDKKDFVKMCKQKYPRLSIKNFERRWYDVKNNQNKKTTIKKSKKIQKKVKKIVNKINHDLEDRITNFDTEKELQPSIQKLIELQDMKKYNFSLTKDFLLKHGFNMGEINWMINHNKIVNQYVKEELEEDEEEEEYVLEENKHKDGFKK